MGIGVVCSTPLSPFNSTRVMTRCSKFTNPPGKATSTPRVFKVVLFLFLFCSSFQCNILRDFHSSLSHLHFPEIHPQTPTHTLATTLCRSSHTANFIIPWVYLKFIIPLQHHNPRTLTIVAMIIILGLQLLLVLLLLLPLMHSRKRFDTYILV